ncbi:hypothetical protein AB0945_12125 [Streptomyces sp. NPDC005474]|uniref:hypothetical protein n=1 Tax=Streptomyces sp. NPDC005474 TaxID=3154878 RepID=UPI0034549DB4
MASQNPPPAGPPYAPPPYPPSQGPQQPRWAWWVVGIVIPVVGLLVTVLVSRPGSSDDKGAESAPTSTPARSSAPAESNGQEQPAPAPAKSAEAKKALYGPVVVDADMTNTGSYIDLDGSGPIVSGATNNGADIIFGASLGLFVPDSASNLAPLPDSGAAPTADECAAAVQETGSYTADPKPGGRFCLMTGKGRVAYLKVVTAPSTGTGKLDVTVWDTPGA